VKKKKQAALLLCGRCLVQRYLLLGVLLWRRFLSDTKLPQRAAGVGLLHPCGHTTQHLQHRFPDILAQAKVEQRVKAGVETAQRKREVQAFPQGAAGLPTSTAAVAAALCLRPLLGPLDGVRQQGEVVGRPAEKEHPHQGQDDTEGPLLLGVQGGSPPQPQQKAGAAGHQDGGGQEEACGVVEQAGCQAPIDTPLRGMRAVVVNTLSSSIFCCLDILQEDPVRDGEEQGEKPH